MASIFKLAIRRLSSTLLASSFSILTLSISVGSVGAALGLLNSVVLNKLAVHDPDRLVTVAPMVGEALLGISGATLAQLAENQSSFADMCGFSRGAVAVEIGGTISRRGDEALSGACYRILGVLPFLGRLIDEADAPLRGSSAPVAVLSHAYWKNTFNADPNVVGRTLRVEASDLTVIGVLPPTFMGLYADQGPDVVVPLGLVSSLLGNGPRVTALYALGRLRPGVSLEQARAEVRSIWPTVWASTNPPTGGGKPPQAADPNNLRTESVSRGISDLRRQYSTAIYVLLVLATILVIMASINVAGLLAAQAAARSVEFKILGALGASRTRIAAQLAAESGLFAVIAGACAAAIASAIGRGVSSSIWVGFLPLTMSLAPGPMLTIGIVLGSILLALALSIPATLICIRQGSSGLVLDARAVRPRASWTRVLLAAQAAFTFALVFFAALLTRNLIELNAINPGYSAAGLSWSRLERIPAASATWDPQTYVGELVERVRAVAGVESAALSNAFPTTEQRNVSSLIPAARVNQAGEVGVGQYRVTPGFFATLGVSIVEGRDFRLEDKVGAPPVAIINTALAHRLFSGPDVIGQTITLGVARKPLTVIGIVPDFSPGDVRIENLPTVYSPYLQEPQLLTSPILVVRAKTESVAVAAIGEAVHAENRHYLTAYRTVTDHLATLLARERILFGLSSLFAALGIMVGATGLFAVLVYSVARRTREIAVRVAIGAGRKSVLLLVIRDEMIAVAIGTLAGIPLALGGARIGQALLYKGTPNDLAVLGACVLILTAGTVIASSAPALRATRVDPANALKEY